MTSFFKKILDLPNVQGMKLTTQNLYEVSLIHNFSEGKLILFSGADELLCQASLCGTAGAIGALSIAAEPQAGHATRPLESCPA